MRFSNWLFSLTNLVQLKLNRCEKCKYLPVALEQLSSLKDLELSQLGSLQYISDADVSDDHYSSYSAMPFFPSLSRLSILCCSNLKGWWKERTGSGSSSSTIYEHEALGCTGSIGTTSATTYKHQPSLLGLTDLEIMRCPDLTSNIPYLPNVERLSLKSCSSNL
ncbi:LRR domain containing protein [Parasponia andersonii]|uniref:LRR domain containing protein n=1 Tax=Parasponia andersonii TaxID=3476 RepID=A0A2P5CCW8_PARAD|nr:LRR domain containing protein [Parasponia andersonii]